MLAPAVVEVKHLTKSYGATRALTDVSLGVKKGRVVALMGRNGAGKSTLVRMLSGLERPDSGEILLDSQLLNLRDPDHALRSGIATVHQEISIIPGLSVAENVMLGRWTSRAGLVDRAYTRKSAKVALEVLGISLPLDLAAGDLRIAEQQLIEIARAISYQPRLLILDEPTSSLTESEADRLVEVVRRLASQGVAVLYVSHRMGEITRVADEVVVFRDGRLVGAEPIEGVTISSLAALMAGHETEEKSDPKPERIYGDSVLEVRDLHTEDKLRGIDLEVASGEVVGLAGRLGSGRTEILRAIAGLDAISKGTVKRPGRPVFSRSRNVAKRLSTGIALVPEDRKAQGIVLSQPILHNMVLSCLRRIQSLGFIRSARERQIGNESLASTEIRIASVKDPVSSLSGGNQQKVVFARCLNAGVEVLLLDEPTRGVDIHSKAQIFDLIDRVAAEGCGVVIVSSEYGELLQNCDRILVVNDGRIEEELQPDVGLERLLTAILIPQTVEKVS